MKPEPTPLVTCPLCDRTVGSRNGRPKMHTIPTSRRPKGVYDPAWCEGANPMQNGMLTTPTPKQESD